MTTAVVDAKIRQLRAEEKALAREAKRVHETALRERAEREVKRESARAAQLEQKRLADAADADLRAFGVELRVSYRGLLYTVFPEMALDQVVRDTALHSLREVQAICSTDFQRRRYGARMAAMQKEPPIPSLMPQSFARLKGHVTEVTRLATKHVGVATLTTAEEEL